MLRYNRKALRLFRTGQNLSVEVLAKRTRLAQRTIHHLERGVSEPRASTLARLASALGVGVEAFFKEGK